MRNSRTLILKKMRNYNNLIFLGFLLHVIPKITKEEKQKKLSLIIIIVYNNTRLKAK